MMEIELKRIANDLCSDVETYFKEQAKKEGKNEQNIECVPIFHEINNSIGVKIYIPEKFGDKYSFVKISTELYEDTYSHVNYNEYLNKFLNMEGVDVEVYRASERVCKYGDLIEKLNDKNIYVDEGQLFIYGDKFAIDVTDIELNHKEIYLQDFFYKDHKFNLETKEWM